MSDKIINIGWVKAHIGIYGNEKTDFLAKSMILNDEYHIEENIPMPICMLKAGLSKKLICDWQTNWNNSTKGRFTYDLLSKVDSNYVCYSQICVYFYTEHGAFQA